MEICRHDEFCGGCIHQGIEYDKQLSIKEKEVRTLLANKDIEYDEFETIVGSPKQYRYRNKMEYTFGDQVKDGEMTLGMHQKGMFMSIITVDECQLVDEDFNLILRATLDFCNKKGYKFYHKRSHQGLVRNLIIRKGERTGELLINIVTSTQVEFSEDEYVAMLLEIQEQGKLTNKIVGIIRTLNDIVSDAVNCEELKVLWGRDYYREKIMGLNFKVSAFSFFQTNVEAVEKLYSEAISMIDDVSGKTVYDLYCGTGTITQVLAQRAKKSIGVELVPEAVEAAKENAKLNGLDNCQFLTGDVFKVLDEIQEMPDVIVVDPPRVGIMQKALDKIIKYNVNQILYVSCNPKTLAINLETLQACGYRVRKVKVFDNFPFTKHVEAVVLLSKVEIDSKKVRVKFSLEGMDMSGYHNDATHGQIK